MAEPLRVLFLDHVSAPSGAEFALVRLLADLGPAVVTPTVVFASDGPMVDKVRALGVETHVLPLPDATRNVRKDELKRAAVLRAAAATGLTVYAARLCRFARDHRIDLIHTNSMKAHVYGGLAGRLAQLPVVWHMRDYVDPSYLPVSAVRGVRVAARVLPSGVVAVSESVLGSLRLPHSAIGRVIHDGLSQQELQPRARRGGEVSWRTPVTVGIVGRISPWKGQHVFLEAAALALAAGHDARFLVIGAPLFGEQGYDAQLRSQAEQLGIAGRVEFRGFCPDIGAIMAELDVLVHASTSADPFPNTVLEGMAAGVPVVASRGGGVQEMIEHGVSGRLAEMGSSGALAIQLDAVLRDPRGARLMGERGYARVRERFTGVETARSVEQFYRDVLSRRESRRSIRGSLRPQAG